MYDIESQILKFSFYEYFYKFLLLKHLLKLLLLIACTDWNRTIPNQYLKRRWLIVIYDSMRFYAILYDTLSIRLLRFLMQNNHIRRQCLNCQPINVSVICFFCSWLILWRSPSEKSCSQERWVFIGFPLIITNFYMIGLHKNVFNMLANQKTAFIISHNWKNIGKKEVKVVRKS